MSALWPSLWLVVVAALSFLLNTTQGQEECEIFYIIQPPSRLSCNPYLDTSRFSLRIECMVAVRRSVGGGRSDFAIQWFAQLGRDTSPDELLLNDTTTFGVRVDQPTLENGEFLIYHSKARITGMEISIYDHFWCQIDASESIRNTTNITDLGRSEATEVLEFDYYSSLSLQFCPQDKFSHQTSLKCADASLDNDDDNDTLSEPPVVVPSSTPQTTVSPLSPTSCPPPVFMGRGGETSKLVSVLLPSLMLPVIVAVLLVIAAVVMTCGRGRNLGKKQGKRRRVNEGASTENLTSPVITQLTTVPRLEEQEISSPNETTAATQTKTPPPRPPLPALKPLVIKNNNRSASPLPTVQASSTSATAQPSNRFSQDIYEDIADSALDSYSMSNDIYSMKAETSGATPGEDRGGGKREVVGRLPHLNGPYFSSKVGKRHDGGGISHYKNAALIAISDKSAPMLVSKKTASSLPSLLDPKHYNDAASPRRRPKEAPDTLRGSQGQHGDHYDSLAQRKTSDHAYYNQKTTVSTGSLALLIEDDEPDYDEVDEEEEEEASRARGGSEGGGTGGTRHLLYPLTAAGKLAGAARQQNCISVMSECYEDMSGMEDFIESYKSATSVTPL